MKRAPEALLLAMFPRDERQSWKPRILEVSAPELAKI
jgi:hypothetical protein